MFLKDDGVGMGHDGLRGYMTLGQTDKTRGFRSERASQYQSPSRFAHGEIGGNGFGSKTSCMHLGDRVSITTKQKGEPMEWRTAFGSAAFANGFDWKQPVGACVGAWMSEWLGGEWLVSGWLISGWLMSGWVGGWWGGSF
jgi:hypothetical protein